MPIIDSWFGYAIISMIAVVASTAALKPNFTRIPSIMGQSAFLSHAFFVLILSFPPIIEKLNGGKSENTILISKLCSVLFLGISQHLRVPTHPLLPPPNTSMRDHMVSFVTISFSALATAFFLKLAGLKCGYSPLPTVSLTNAFLVVFAVLFVYLLVFADLIRKGYSRQWANVVLVLTLICINTQPFHLNPIVTLVSCVMHGLHMLYAAHAAAIASAILAARAVENLKSSAAARLKQQ
jgi:hypothetical protein